VARLAQYAALVTPTQRTLAELRRQGYLAAVVEKWNPHAKVRQDLFGIIDVLAVEPRAAPWGIRTLAVQATSGSNVAARVTKLRAARWPPPTKRKPAGELVFPPLLAAGWRIEVWGWRNSAASRRWELRRAVVD
jgi:hypothetical protein